MDIRCRSPEPKQERHRRTGSVFRQVRYDFAQLYDWYVGPFRSIPRNGVTTTDIDEARNQLALGVEDSVAYRRALRLVETLPIPHGAVRVDVVGKICAGPGAECVEGFRGTLRDSSR